MWLKKIMSDEDRYIDFVGSLETYNEQVFGMEFFYQLLDTSSARYAFRYSLSTFSKYLRAAYLTYRMDLVNPPILLGIEKNSVFLKIKGGPKLPHMPEEEVDIYTQDFNLSSLQRQYYSAVFDPKCRRLKFHKTNLIFVFR